MTKQQKLVLWVSILASFVAFLDGSIVNVALPAMVRELGGGLTAQQWIVDAYLITLGSLMLIAGSVSDLFGRKRVLVGGLIGFGLASALCAVAQDATFVIIGRGLQGVAGAFLVPSSLALIMSAFEGSEKGKAIGTWTAWTGISFIVGALVGGLLVDSVSWRLIFAINILPIAFTLWLIGRLEHSDHRDTAATLDIRGAALCALGLGGPVYALIEQPHYGWSDPLIYAPLAAGLLIFATFLWYERRISRPMLPLELFRARNFSFGNLATLFIYAGLSVATFLITVFIQQVGGYSAIEAGMSLLPVTIIMFFLSSRFGKLAGRFGPRLFMTIGPLMGGAGFLSMLSVRLPIHYWTQLLPGVLLFGLGLATTVAPLTSAVLGSIDSREAGIASAINNAVSRIAGLVAIAFIGVVTGPHLGVDGFHRGLVLTAALLFAGGSISFLGIQNSPGKPLRSVSRSQPDLVQ